MAAVAAPASAPVRVPPYKPQSGWRRLTASGPTDRGGWIDITPRSLTAVKRQQLALLHRILARVVGDDNDVDGDKDYQLERADILEKGFVGAYPTEFIAIRPELSVDESRFVVGVLNMFRVITFSLEALRRDGVEPDESLQLAFEFLGFDQNDPRETRLLGWVRYLVDGEHWGELADGFRDHDDGNLHSPMAPVYERMLDEYNRIQARKRNDLGRPGADLLTREELERIGRAHIHPDNR
jgi:uncharacterized protein YfbU (UPF0304 family)